MDTAWAKLLKRLQLTDDQVYAVVVQACRKQYGPKATEEFCQAVRSEVFIKLNALLDNPERDFFSSAKKFRGYVRRMAPRVHGADIRERYDLVRTPVSYLPGDVIDQKPDLEKNDLDWERLRECITNCDEAWQRCLSDAKDEWQKVFRLACEQKQPRDIASQLGLNSMKVWRYMEQACTVFRRNCWHLWAETSRHQEGER